MDPNSTWNADAGQVPSGSHAGLNDMDELFDTQELFNSLGDWTHHFHDVENPQEEPLATQFPSMHHDLDVLDMHQIPEVGDSANPETFADTDPFGIVQRWIATKDAANLDFCADIDNVAMNQFWDLPDMTNPTQDLEMTTMPLGPYSYQTFQSVDPTLLRPPSQETTSKDCSTSNGVSAQEYYSYPVAQTQSFDPGMTAQVGDNSLIIENLAQGSHHRTHLDPSSSAEVEQSSCHGHDSVKFEASNPRFSKRRLPRIPENARKLLNQHFLANAYPDTTEIDALSVLTKQEPSRIKNWFSNARARRPIPGM
jgi:hypothetical protein